MEKAGKLMWQIVTRTREKERSLPSPQLDSWMDQLIANCQKRRKIIAVYCLTQLNLNDIIGQNMSQILMSTIEDFSLAHKAIKGRSCAMT